MLVVRLDNTRIGSGTLHPASILLRCFHRVVRLSHSQNASVTCRPQSKSVLAGILLVHLELPRLDRSLNGFTIIANSATGLLRQDLAIGEKPTSRVIFEGALGQCHVAPDTGGTRLRRALSRTAASGEDDHHRCNDRAY